MVSKEYFLEAVIAKAQEGKNGPIRLLDMGCGTARYVPEVLARHPDLTYVGIEPIESSYHKACENLAGESRAEVHYALGYTPLVGIAEASFDIVVSFSVLEHVKHLDQFIALSAHYVRPGGLVVHRYDLGHALYPSGPKERLHVWLGNAFPALLPERRFVRYVPLPEVVELFKTHIGAVPSMYTYHQSPGTKRLAEQGMKYSLDPAVYMDMFAWEFRISPEISKLPISIQETMFPTIAVWGQKPV